MRKSQIAKLECCRPAIFNISINHLLKRQTLLSSGLFGTLAALIVNYNTAQAQTLPAFSFSSAANSFTDNNWNFGVNFTVTKPVTVSALGYYAGGAGSTVSNNPVSLYSVSGGFAGGTGTLLATAVVTNSSILISDFRYTTISAITLQPGTYQLDGVSNNVPYTWNDLGFATASSITYSGNTWQVATSTTTPVFLNFVQNDVTDGYWGANLLLGQATSTQTINTNQPYYLASALGTTVAPTFQGGTLRLDQATTFSQNFTLDGSSTNTFDQFGNFSILSGVISNAVAGTPGNIIFANSGTGGSVTLTGANTYSGTTTINSGATLIIGGGGSITNQSSITNSGILIVDNGASVTVGTITNNLTGVLNNFGTITDALNNSGQVTNTGVYNSDVNNFSPGVIFNNGTWNGSLLTNTSSIFNSGTWNAASFTNNLRGTVFNTGTLTATTSITNAGTFFAQGTLTTPALTNTGTFTVTNSLATAITTLNNSSVLNLQTGNLSGSITTLNNSGALNLVAGQLSGNISNFNNSGTVTLTASTLTGTIGTLTNSGIINLANGLTTNILAANNYVSQNGTLIINANFAANATGQRASLLNVNTLSGTNNIIVSAGTTPGLIATPIPIINAGTTAPGTSVSATVLNAPNPNIINYSVQQIGGQYDLVSTVNTGHVSSPPTGIDAILTALNTGFFQNASAFISEPPNPAPNQVNGGPWIRFSGGQNDVSSTTAAANPSGTSTAQTKVRTSFNGFQTGMDLGVANIENTGWNTHVGVTAGQVLLNTSNIVGSSATSQNTIPFLGVYFALTGHGLFVDGMIREDFYNVGISDQQANLNAATITGKALSVNWSAGYKYDVNPQFFAEPSAALMYSQLHMEALRLPLDTSNQTYGTLAFNPFNSLLGRFGVRLGTTYVAEQYGLVLQPFVTGSVWHEFESNTTSSFEATGTSVPLSVTRIGTFGQLGAGVSGQILQTGLVGFVRGDYRFGQNINGYNVVGGLRYEF